MEAHTCDTFECRIKTVKQCSLCKRSHYCSAEHQKQEWSKHKLVCKRTDIVNGYELCGMLLKCNEEIDFSMVGMHMDNVVVDSEQNTVSITAQKGEEMTLVDSPEIFGANERDEKRAYWALRSMCSDFIMPLALDAILDLLSRNGYNHIIFTDSNRSPIELSLKEKYMRCWSMKPTIQVKTNVPLPKLDSHITNVVDGYVIDLTAGQFWCFDGEERPIILTPPRTYISYIGENGEEKTRSIGTIIEEGIKKEYHKTHSAGLIRKVIERLGFSWKENIPPHLKGADTNTQAEKLRVLKELGDEKMKFMLATYLTSEEVETPVTRILHGVHSEMLQEESSLMTDV